MPFLTFECAGYSTHGRSFDIAVKEAVASLKKGGVIATPTDTIYGIAALVQNTKSVDQLYRIKKRDDAKPIAACVGDICDIFRYCKAPQQTYHRKKCDIFLYYVTCYLGSCLYLKCLLTF